MRDKQIELLFKVLRILQKQGVLKDLMVVGSWCLYFYNFYFSRKAPIASLRTRDVDFMVPDPQALKINIDLPQILESLDFVVDYRGEEGHIRLVHPELFIEFLVPEKGRGSDKAFALPSLGVNAQRLRFLDILYLKPINIKVDGIELMIPHPAVFLLHKVIIFKRRSSKSKREQELEQIQRIFEVLRKEGDLASLKQVFPMLHNKWQRKIVANLKEISQNDILEVLL